MEFHEEPRIEQQLRLRKIVIISSAVAVLATTIFFIYSNIASRTKSFGATPSGSNTVSGTVFCDPDQSGSKSNEEAIFVGLKVHVYHDLNGNGSLDAGDSLFTTGATNSSGIYSFVLTYYTGSGHPNTYILETDSSGLTGCTSTTGGSAAVSFTSSSNTVSQDFGIANACGVNGANYVSGLLFNDANQDGTRDTTEPGLGQINVILHQDLDGDGVISTGDIVMDTTTSDANGNFRFYVAYCTTEDSVNIGARWRWNDAYETSSGINVWGQSIDLQDGLSAFRFNTVDIPSGATITSATLTFTAGNNSNSSSSTVTIYGHDNGNSPWIRSQSNNLLNRTKTTASVSWSIPQFTNNQSYTTDNLKDIVQEIIDRSDWRARRNMAFLIENGSGSSREIRTVDNSSSSNAVLNVKYRVGGIQQNRFIVEIDSTSNPDLQGMTTAHTYTTAFAGSGLQDTTGIAGGYSPSTLPVDLIYFKANKPDEFSVDLKWATAMEENNSHFDIERRADNGEFIRIDRIQGHGNSDVVLRYKYTDYNYPASAGIIYYRLKQVDFDGKYEYSPIVYVGGEENVQTRVFPNPADEQVTISVPGESFDVQLISSVGVPVKEIRDAYDQVSIPTISLHNGYYVARIVVNGQERSEKVLIRHTTN